MIPVKPQTKRQTCHYHKACPPIYCSVAVECSVCEHWYADEPTPEQRVAQSAATGDEMREITERLAKWMGWTLVPDDQVFALLSCHAKDDHVVVWRNDRPVEFAEEFGPMVSLDDARLLLVECDKRGLMLAVAQAVWNETDYEDFHDSDRVEISGISAGLLATPSRITLAIDEVVRGLPKEKV